MYIVPFSFRHHAKRHFAGFCLLDNNRKIERVKAALLHGTKAARYSPITLDGTKRARCPSFKPVLLGICEWADPTATVIHGVYIYIQHWIPYRDGSRYRTVGYVYITADDLMISWAPFVSTGGALWYEVRMKLVRDLTANSSSVVDSETLRILQHWTKKKNLLRRHYEDTRLINNQPRLFLECISMWLLFLCWPSYGMQNEGGTVGSESVKVLLIDRDGFIYNAMGRSIARIWVRAVQYLYI